MNRTGSDTSTCVHQAERYLESPRSKAARLERDLRIRETSHGLEPLDQVQLVVVLSNLGSAYVGLGECVKACHTLERALSIQEAHHDITFRVLANLGFAYLKLGDYLKVCYTLERAMGIRKAHDGVADADWFSVLSKLAKSYFLLGDDVKVCETVAMAVPDLLCSLGKVALKIGFMSGTCVYMMVSSNDTASMVKASALDCLAHRTRIHARASDVDCVHGVHKIPNDAPVKEWPGIQPSIINEITLIVT